MNSWMFENACLVIFAKAPEPGKVKTRLIPAIGAEQAARLHRRLLFESLELAHRERLCRVQLWCSPSDAHPVFKAAQDRFPLSLHTQAGSDLGERMERAISENLNRFGSVVLIGCDCPSLTPEDLVTVFSVLEGQAEVVIGPAEDGGYVLIGMRRRAPELFRNMPWGSGRVLAETRSRIRRSGLSCFETGIQWDLDRPEDLERYRVQTESEEK